MSYFEDVYLKRMNVDGNNTVDRVKTRKEKEFDKLFLPKTKYGARIYQINDSATDIPISLQPNAWNESSIISNFLLSTKAQKLHTGDIVLTTQKVKDQERQGTWIIIYIDKDMTRGYQKYQTILLDAEVNYTNEYEDTLQIFPAKFVNSSSTFVSDNFTFSSSEPPYGEPDVQRRMICKNYDFLHKGLYFYYKDRGWEITGIDNISIENVAYVSLSEVLIREPEPKNSEELPISDDTNFFLINR